MIYVDTSALIKLYIKEPGSDQVAEWLKKNDEPIPLTGLIKLEFNNALKLKQFRNELEQDEFEQVISRLRDHEKRGVYYRPVLDWPSVFSLSFSLSKNHTHEYGTRSLDILHIGTAHAINADTFLTLDERQTRLSERSGLITINPVEKK